MLNIAQLKSLSEIINLTALCSRAGLNRQTINTKLRNNTELKVSESEKLMEALTSFGLKMIHR